MSHLYQYIFDDTHVVAIAINCRHNPELNSQYLRALAKKFPADAGVKKHALTQIKDPHQDFVFITPGKRASIAFAKAIAMACISAILNYPTSKSLTWYRNKIRVFSPVVLFGDDDEFKAAYRHYLTVSKQRLAAMDVKASNKSGLTLSSSPLDVVMYEEAVYLDEAKANADTVDVSRLPFKSNFDINARPEERVNGQRNAYFAVKKNKPAHWVAQSSTEKQPHWKVMMEAAYAEIAKMAGVSVNSMRLAAKKKRDGSIKLYSLFKPVSTIVYGINYIPELKDAHCRHLGACADEMLFLARADNHAGNSIYLHELDRVILIDFDSCSYRTQRQCSGDAADPMFYFAAKNDAVSEDASTTDVYVSSGSGEESCAEYRYARYRSCIETGKLDVTNLANYTGDELTSDGEWGRILTTLQGGPTRAVIARHLENYSRSSKRYYRWCFYLLRQTVEHTIITAIVQHPVVAAIDKQNNFFRRQAYLQSMTSDSGFIAFFAKYNQTILKVVLNQLMNYFTSKKKCYGDPNILLRQVAEDFLFLCQQCRVPAPYSDAAIDALLTQALARDVDDDMKDFCQREGLDVEFMSMCHPYLNDLINISSKLKFYSSHVSHRAAVNHKRFFKLIEHIHRQVFVKFTAHQQRMALLPAVFQNYAQACRSFLQGFEPGHCFTQAELRHYTSVFIKTVEKLGLTPDIIKLVIFDMIRLGLLPQHYAVFDKIAGFDFCLISGSDKHTLLDGLSDYLIGHFACADKCRAFLTAGQPLLHAIDAYEANVTTLALAYIPLLRLLDEDVASILALQLMPRLCGAEGHKRIQCLYELHDMLSTYAETILTTTITNSYLHDRYPGVASNNTLVILCYDDNQYVEVLMLAICSYFSAEQDQTMREHFVASLRAIANTADYPASITEPLLCILADAVSDVAEPSSVADPDHIGYTTAMG